MERNDLILAAMAPAGRASHSPVQIQKLLFLIDQRMPDATGGPHFSFQPYHYGPFDKQIPYALERLKYEGYIDIQREPARRWESYSLSDCGIERGKEMLLSLSPPAKKYVEDLSEWVRKLTFAQLVSSIYAEYPAMKAHSVFAS